MYQRAATPVQRRMVLLMGGVAGLLALWVIPEVAGIASPAVEDTYSEWVWDLPAAGVVAIALAHMVVGVLAVWSSIHFFEGYVSRRRVEARNTVRLIAAVQATTPPPPAEIVVPEDGVAPISWQAIRYYPQRITAAVSLLSGLAATLGLDARWGLGVTAAVHVAMTLFYGEPRTMSKAVVRDVVDAEHDDPAVA